MHPEHAYGSWCWLRPSDPRESKFWPFDDVDRVCRIDVCEALLRPSCIPNDAGAATAALGESEDLHAVVFVALIVTECPISTHHGHAVAAFDQRSPKGACVGANTAVRFWRVFRAEEADVHVTRCSVTQRDGNVPLKSGGLRMALGPRSHGPEFSRNASL